MNAPTAFKYDFDYLQDRYHDKEKSWLSRNPDKTAEDYEQRIYEITAELALEYELNYLRFGPYWESVKNVLYKHFRKLDFKTMDGGSFMPMWYDVKDPITGETNDKLTIIAAWEFKDYYDKNFFEGTREFQLWEDNPEEWWNATDRYFELLFNPIAAW